MKDPGDNVGVTDVEGCRAGVEWRASILELETTLVFVPSVVGVMGLAGLVFGWRFGTGGYAVMLGLPVLAWAVFFVASWVARRRVVSPPGTEKDPISAVRSRWESEYRVAGLQGGVASVGGTVRHTGRLYRLEPVSVRVWNSPVRGDDASRGIVAGCVYHRKWMCSGELFIWVGEAVVVDDEGHAVVLVAPCAGLHGPSVVTVVPTQSDGHVRLWPLWAGDDAAARTIRGIVPRAVASLLMEGETAVLEAQSAEAAPPARASRAAVEARVGPVKSLRWVDLETSRTLRLRPVRA